MRLTGWNTRWRVLGAMLLGFVGVNLAVRLGLAALNGDAALWWPDRLLPALAIGAIFDLGVGLIGLAPLGLLVALWPAGRAKGLSLLLTLALLPSAVLVVLVGGAEFTFWNEFASRFNFIAVDYLIYTQEVLGNIRESYNLPLLLAVAGVVSLLVWWPLSAWVRRMLKADDLPRVPAWQVLSWALLPWLAWQGLDSRYKEFSDDAQLNELAGNGYFDFWHAFWSNEIDYDRFYARLPESKAMQVLAHELTSFSRTPVRVAQRPFERLITASGPEIRKNVVLISVESLSASFLTAFGNRQGLTPNLDRLAREGLLFTRLYATGTRTVRGLEAITLSVPPTPGHSIVKRPDNAHLFSLGEVFKSKGYEPLYIYGGYGYFDNMNAFFGGNGYTVVDRTAIAADQIHFENVWGVADEDLFTLALQQLDDRDRRRVPFFAHVMTTSNHRPFTYPEGRIDIPSHTGREGGVKYTDWALGRFFEQARQRPWFKDTIFVVVADHTHNGRGKSELPPENYHIPMIVYAPGFVSPGTVDSVASQIDVAPTLLGMLHMSYRSRFFGQDIFNEGVRHQRALMANYQTVGYFEHGVMVELKPNARYRLVDVSTGRAHPMDDVGKELLDEAISYYQVASEAYRKGELRGLP